MNEQESISSAEQPSPALEKPPVVRKRFSLIIGAAVMLLAAILLIEAYSGPKYEHISAVYSGARAADIVLDSNNADIHVTGVKKNGEKAEIPLGKWEIPEPATLEPDSFSTVTVRYKKLETELRVHCSTSLVKGITSSYDGDTAEGVVIDPKNAALHVVAAFQNGDKKDVTKDCSVEGGSVKLERDKTSKVTVLYADPYNDAVFSDSISVKCSTRTVIRISAKYSGKTTAGVKLDSKNDGIAVTAIYKDGASEKVTGWKINSPVTLKADESASVTISYEGVSCTLKVQCSTVSEGVYKGRCAQVSYDSLSRYSSDWKGELVKISGRVFQVISEGGGWSPYKLLVATSGRSNNLIYVLFYGSLDYRILEGDAVTIYGKADGLYSYRTVLGASRTVPEIKAEYLN